MAVRNKGIALDILYLVDTTIIKKLAIKKEGQS